MAVSFELGPDGQVRIPEELRAAAGWSQGETLVGYVDDGQLVIQTRESIKQRLRAEAALAKQRSGGALGRLQADKHAATGGAQQQA